MNCLLSVALLLVSFSSLVCGVPYNTYSNLFCDNPEPSDFACGWYFLVLARILKELTIDSCRNPYLGASQYYNVFVNGVPVATDVANNGWGTYCTRGQSYMVYVVQINNTGDPSNNHTIGCPGLPDTGERKSNFKS